MSHLKILLACTGSVAAVNLIEIVEELQKAFKDCHIKVILTEKAKNFAPLPATSEKLQIYTDEEWNSWTLGRGILHIEFSNWADLMLIAPLTANTMAKIANGMCDNLVTCTVRAWDMSKPLFFALSMNTNMYLHPVTQPQINVLTGWGYIEIPTAEKLLACGVTGYGGLADIDTIVQAIANHITAS